MDQEKIGKFIKEIRKKNNLTQAELAEKYNVTYQAVSKWENGKNMPDISLIKQMSKDFNISLEEFYDGEYKNIKKNKNWLLKKLAKRNVQAADIFYAFYKKNSIYLIKKSDIN